MEGKQIRIQAKQNDSGMFALILPLRFSVRESVRIAFIQTDFLFFCSIKQIGNITGENISFTVKKSV